MTIELLSILLVFFASYLVTTAIMHLVDFLFKKIMKKKETLNNKKVQLKQQVETEIQAQREIDKHYTEAKKRKLPDWFKREIESI